MIDHSFKQVEDLTENKHIHNKYTISLFLNILINILINIKIRYISFSEKTILIKNHILILCIHYCLDKGNTHVDIDVCFIAWCIC